jgi:uncharacterized protein (TIGR03086 family)
MMSIESNAYNQKEWVNMDGAELFSQCLAQATSVVKQVRPEQFANATPCDDWHVRDLVDHLMAELRAVPKLLGGETIQSTADNDESDEGVVSETDNDLSFDWQIAADAAENASSQADPEELAHTVGGDVSNDVYLCRIATDLLIHAWDLAVAIGMPIAFALDSALAAYDHSLSPDFAMQPDDACAPPHSIDENAPPQSKLLALYGRSSDWRAAG